MWLSTNTVGCCGIWLSANTVGGAVNAKSNATKMATDFVTNTVNEAHVHPI
jgi:hypothetical protein